MEGRGCPREGEGGGGCLWEVGVGRGLRGSVEVTGRGIRGRVEVEGGSAAG